jgi:hypothetical protein
MADYNAAIALFGFLIIYLVLQLIALPFIFYFKRNHTKEKIISIHKFLIAVQYSLLVILIGTILFKPFTYTYSIHWGGGSGSTSSGPVFFNLFYVGLSLLHLLLCSITYFSNKQNGLVLKKSKLSFLLNIFLFIVLISRYWYYIEFVRRDTSGG